MRAQLLLGGFLLCALGCQTAPSKSSESVALFPKITKILVSKSSHKMDLISENHVFKTYKISLGENPIGPKEQEGDQRTPEGLYKISSKSEQSTYYKNLGISYPNSSDKKRAQVLGVSPGGDIKIHGLKNGYGFWGMWHRWIDWTNGCIAVTNEEMDELYEIVPLQTPIEIVP